MKPEELERTQEEYARSKAGGLLEKIKEVGSPVWKIKWDNPDIDASYKQGYKDGIEITFRMIHARYIFDGWLGEYTEGLVDGLGEVARIVVDFLEEYENE